MLLGLLFALIFGSGGESEFASSVPNLKREVKINITDKVRRDSVLVLVDRYEAAINDYEKEKDHLQEQVNKVSTDRDVSSDEFLSHYDEYYQARFMLISSLIDYRLMIQKQITEKELLLVIENAIKISSDKRRDQEKREEDTEDNLNLAFSKIHDIITRNIVDPDKSETVTQSFYEFERTMYNYVDTSRDTDAEKTAMLLNTNPTKKELERMYDRSNQLRYNAARDFAILREKVIQNTNEREWKEINKELKKFFKS
jgi:hypothetical protein